MIFSPALCALVLNGRKVMTRRRTTHRNGRGIAYRRGGVYSIQPGRGKRHAGHIKVTSVRHEPLRMLTSFDARAEGFEDRREFYAYWQKLYGGINKDEIVTVIRFERAPPCDACAPLEGT